MDVSVVIPTWNGEALLRRHLPAVLEEATRYRESGCGRVEVIVVDDASSDATPALLDGLAVRLVRRREQGGFARACNSGIEAAEFPCLVLVNNDVQVDAGFLQAIVEPFSCEGVFAVTARIFEPGSGLLATAGKIGSFRRGFWSVYFNYDCRPPLPPPEARLSAYAVGGFCAFRTAPLREMGGFDEVFSPFHWEDVDLSYRAWKRGWLVVYQPRAVGWHQASSTIGRAYSRRQVETTAVRNRLLFHWKNLHDPALLWQHLAMLGLLLATRWMAADGGFYRAFLQALRRWPQVRPGRVREKSAARRSDRALRDLMRSFSRQPGIEIFRSRAEVEQRHHERLRGPDYPE